MTVLRRRFAGRKRLCFSPRVSARAGEATDLEHEARVFGRYLVGTTPPPELVERYARACRALLPEATRSREARVVGFARRHPWSTPLLDGASGLLAPRGLLRTKLLVAMAVLEASREFADEFLPRESPPPGPTRLAAKLAGLGLLGVAQVLLGVLLYPIAARS